MKHLYFLLGALIPMLLACCTGKKSNGQEAEAQPLFDITAPAFDKFVVVADDEGTPVYKEADTSSPMLVYWTEDIESDMAGVENHWSNEAVKSGYISDSFVAWPGTVYAVLGEEGYPYTVPLDFLYREGKLYFHGAREGHKLDALRRCSKVSFCVMDEGYRREGEWELNIKSVVVFGHVRILPWDEPGIEELLRALGNRYNPDPADVEKEIRGHIHRVQMLELTIEHMTGKLVNES